MADTWDGATTTVGVLVATFNTDKTAVRFARTDLATFDDDVPLTICNTLAQQLVAAAENCERLASSLDPIDSRFAGTCRSQATKYRQAAGVA